MALAPTKCSTNLRDWVSRKLFRVPATKVKGGQERKARKAPHILYVDALPPVPSVRSRVLEIMELTLGLQRSSIEKLLPTSTWVPEVNPSNGVQTNWRLPPLALSMDYSGFRKSTCGVPITLPSSDSMSFRSVYVMLQWGSSTGENEKALPWILTTCPDSNFLMINLTAIRTRLPNKTLRRVGLNLIRVGMDATTARTFRIDFAEGFVLVTLRERP